MRYPPSPSSRPWTTCESPTRVFFSSSILPYIDRDQYRTCGLRAGFDQACHPIFRAIYMFLLRLKLQSSILASLSIGSPTKPMPPKHQPADSVQLAPCNPPAASRTKRPSVLFEFEERNGILVLGCDYHPCPFSSFLILWMCNALSFVNGALHDSWQRGHRA